jgi:hypothetical protein
LSARCDGQVGGGANHRRCEGIALATAEFGNSAYSFTEGVSETLEPPSAGQNQIEARLNRSHRDFKPAEREACLRVGHGADNGQADSYRCR